MCMYSLLLIMHPNVYAQFSFYHFWGTHDVSEWTGQKKLLFKKYFTPDQQFFYGMSYGYLHKLCLVFVIAKMLHQTVVASCQFSRTIDWKKIITTSPGWENLTGESNLLSETCTNNLDVKNQVWIDGFHKKNRQQNNVLCVGKMDSKNKQQPKKKCIICL